MNSRWHRHCGQFVTRINTLFVLKHSLDDVHLLSSLCFRVVIFGLSLSDGSFIASLHFIHGRWLRAARPSYINQSVLITSRSSSSECWPNAGVVNAPPSFRPSLQSIIFKTNSTCQSKTYWWNFWRPKRNKLLVDCRVKKMLCRCSGMGVTFNGVFSVMDAALSGVRQYERLVTVKGWGLERVTSLDAGVASSARAVALH